MQDRCIGVPFPGRAVNVAHEARNGRRDLIGADRGAWSNGPLVEIARQGQRSERSQPDGRSTCRVHRPPPERSEEHTSELQSPCNLVCRLLLEKKKKQK